MAAALITASDREQPHLLRLPDPGGTASALQEIRYAVETPVPPPGSVILEAGSWLLRVPELLQIQSLLRSLDLILVGVRSLCPETLVAAAAIGVDTGASPKPKDAQAPAPATSSLPRPRDLLVHRGTLRAGDHLHSETSVLLLGDVNPGARISATGHVLVWGRLRGVAHAGFQGECQARIVALQLRPLQLRIADAVARGPEETPPPGLAEEARLVNGEIRIDPASPGWPLDG